MIELCTSHLLALVQIGRFICAESALRVIKRWLEIGRQLYFDLYLRRLRPDKRRRDRREQYDGDNGERESGGNRALIKSLQQVGDEHLRSDEGEHDGKSCFEIMKFFDDAREQKVESAQAENGKDV